MAMPASCQTHWLGASLHGQHHHAMLATAAASRFHIVVGLRPPGCKRVSGSTRGLRACYSALRGLAMQLRRVGCNGYTRPPASLGRHSALFGMIQADRGSMVHALPQAA
jgi:hypothetical protein